MKIKSLHRWDLSSKEATEIQRDLKSRLILKNKFKKIETVAGADMAIDDEEKRGFAGVIVYSFKDMEEIERCDATVPIGMPYIPGLLAFREGPVLIEALKKLKTAPDLFMFDGQGVAHPRGLGIASHMGLVLGKPAIGCAKSRLIGEYEEPGNDVGDWSPLFCYPQITQISKKKSKKSAQSVDKTNQVIGAALRTRKNVKPIFVSQGHMIDLETSLEIVLKCLDRTRIPKPTREADRFVNQLRGL